MDEVLLLKKKKTKNFFVGKKLAVFNMHFREVMMKSVCISHYAYVISCDGRE